MTPSAIALFAGLSVAVMHVIVVSSLLHWVRSIGPVIIHMGATVAMSVMLLLILAFLAERLRIILPVWPALSMLVGASIVWLYAFSAVYKSISLSILTALAAVPDGRLAAAGIARDVVLPRFIKRVELLIADGYVIKAAHGYAITSKGRRAARRLQGIQRLFGVSGNGLYRIQ